MAGTSLQTSRTAAGDNVVYADKVQTVVAPNYVRASGSAENAITADFEDINGNDITLVTGTCLLLKLDKSLQAGANTLAINGGSATAIKKQNNQQDINTTFVAGSVIQVVYTPGVAGGCWQIMGNLG